VSEDSCIELLLVVHTWARARVGGNQTSHQNRTGSLSMTTPFSYCSCVLAQQQMHEPKEQMNQQTYG
jgi:hypothetical protein